MLFTLSIITIIKRILLEDIAFLYYLFTGKLKSALAIAGANLWCIVNIKYLLKRKNNNKTIIKSHYQISNDLMVPYSIVKTYFYNKKKRFTQLD